MTFVSFLTRPEPGRPVVYTAEWVNRLWSGLRRWRSGAMRLVCFTDQPKGIRAEVETRPLLDRTLETWWHRMPLFDPEVGRSIADGAPFTNIDLDTVIVGPLDWIGQVDAPFVGVRDWGASHRLNGGLWTLTPGAYASVWTAFSAAREDIQRRWRTDDAWIGTAFPAPAFYQDAFPGRIWSYKWGHLGELKGAEPLQECPVGASVIAFHGKPKPSDLPADHWARRVWEDADLDAYDREWLPAFTYCLDENLRREYEGKP